MLHYLKNGITLKEIAKQMGLNGRLRHQVNDAEKSGLIHPIRLKNVPAAYGRIGSSALYLLLPEDAEFLIKKKNGNDKPTKNNVLTKKEREDYIKKVYFRLMKTQD